MDEIFVWNALTELTSILAYHFWIDFYYTDPETRRQFSMDQKMEKLSVAKTKFYSQRTEILKELNLSGIQDVTDIYIRVIQEMVGSDDPPLIYGPPRLRDWPPEKKELPADQDPQITEFISGSQAASSAEEEGEATEQEEENDDGEGNQDEQNGNGEGGENGGGENRNGDGGGILQRLKENPRLPLILGAIGSIILIVGLFWLAGRLPRRVIPPILGDLFGVESRTPVPTATITPSPRPTHDETATQQSFEASVEAAVIIAEASRPTEDTRARQETAVAATLTQLASHFTDTPTPIPTNTDTPTHTPTPTLTPAPTPDPRLFSDDFNQGRSDLWVVNSGVPRVVQNRLSADETTWLTIGDSSWTDYVVTFEVVEASGCWFGEGNVIAIRVKDLDNFIAYHWADCESLWYEVVDGKWNEITGMPNRVGSNDGNNFIISAEGREIILKIDGQKIFSFETEGFLEGGIGVRLKRGAQIDNLVVEEIP